MSPLPLFRSIPAEQHAVPPSWLARAFGRVVADKTPLSRFLRIRSADAHRGLCGGRAAVSYRNQHTKSSSRIKAVLSCCTDPALNMLPFGSFACSSRTRQREEAWRSRNSTLRPWLAISGRFMGCVWRVGRDRVGLACSDAMRRSRERSVGKHVQLTRRGVFSTAAVARSQRPR